MSDCKVKSITGQIQLLMETEPDFPQRFKECLVFESSKVANPFQFIAGLISKGVLGAGSDESEVGFGLKKTMVQLALMIACSRGAEAVGGLMEALEGSGNSELVSAVWTKFTQDFDTDTDGGLSEPKGDHSSVQTPTTEMLAKQVKSSLEFSSVATQLIDMIMSQEQEDFMEQLEAHFVFKASEIVNTVGFLSDLEQRNFLGESDQELKSEPEADEEQWTAKAIKAACSTKAIGSLIAAFQHSGNEHILQETLEWLEALQATRKNYPIAVKSLTGRQIDEEPNLVRSAFFEQAAPLNDLEKVATFNCQPESSTTAAGAFSLKFNRDRMIANLTDGAVKLWNWRKDEDMTFEFGAKVKEITSMEYDEEICVLGTANGTVYLFDAVTLEAKWFIRLGEPVQSLKFVESTLTIVTRVGYICKFWWIQISRADMRLSNKRLVLTRWCDAGNSGVCIHSDCSFLYYSNFVNVYGTESGRHMMDERGNECSLEAPANINTLNVVDFISTNKIVLAGCTNGMIAMWNGCKLGQQQLPMKTFQAKTEAIVALCSLNGHLLSVDKGGKLLMWSGYDLESKNGVAPVPQVLADNFANVDWLVAHDRWFATSSTENGIVNIWTLPDLWLLCG